MKANILLFLFFSLLFLQITPAQNVEPQFSELKGNEDSENTTHLFYRIYSSSESGFRNDIFRWNLSTGLDTFFLGEGGQTSPPLLAFNYTDDYDFWSLDSLEYIYCGSDCGIECGTYVQRSDTNANLQGGDFGRSLNINIGVDPNTVFYGLDGWTTLVKSMKSTDGGFNWTELSDQYYFYTLSPFNDEISFYLNDNGDLFKSTDGGASFYQVNITGASIYGEDTDFYFDQDSNHIYLNYFDHTNYYFSVSNNFGESNSWQIKKISNVPIHLSNDSQNGVIFLAEGEMIYKSTDYGDTFTLFNTLDDDIIDIYKKPNSDKLYAATKYRIYEVTAGSVSIIKQLQPVSVNDLKNITPDEFVLHQNFPNPLNPVTKISWQSPVGGHQSLKVYDVLGNEVATLVDEYKPAGSYEVEFDATGITSGVYFYRLSAGSYLEVKKMIVTK